MTALHTYSYIVIDTQRGSHTLKYKAIFRKAKSKRRRRKW